MMLPPFPQDEALRLEVLRRHDLLSAAHDPFLDALATTVDFGRELRDGDGFYVRWEQQYSIEGAPIGVGRVLWAELQLQGRRVASIHRFKPKFGPEVFYTANGQATTSVMGSEALGVRSTGKAIRAASC